MFQAETTSNTNRRAVLAGLVNTSLAASLGWSPLASMPADSVHPDADLIALGYDFNRAAAGFDALEPSHPAPQCDAAWEAASRIGQQIAAMQAKSIEGLLVKARVLHWLHDAEIEVDEESTTDTRLAFGLARDLLNLGAAA